MRKTVVANTGIPADGLIVSSSKENPRNPLLNTAKAVQVNSELLKFEVVTVSY